MSVVKLAVYRQYLAINCLSCEINGLLGEEGSTGHIIGYERQHPSCDYGHDAEEVQRGTIGIDNK